jgi:hypothetical protein
MTLFLFRHCGSVEADTKHSQNTNKGSSLLLLSTPRRHNMYSNILHIIIMTCLMTLLSMLIILINLPESILVGGFIKSAD